MEGPLAPQHIPDLGSPLPPSLTTSALPTPAFPSSGPMSDPAGAGSANEGVSRPASVLTGNAPVFVPAALLGQGVAGLYRPKLRLAFPPGENAIATGTSALAQRRKHRRNASSRVREAAAQNQTQAYAPMPSYPPGFATPTSASPLPVQQKAEEHPLVRWWKHFTPEELDSLQNALQDLMFTASRLVDEDARRAMQVDEQTAEAKEMKDAQGRLAQWVHALVLWREGLPVGDPRSKS